MLVFLYIVIQFFFLILVFYLTIAFLTGAPFVPTTNTASLAMMNMVKIKKGMKIYDLGSGDGRLLFLAADRGAEAVGYEINPFLVLLTGVKKLWSKQRTSIRCYWKNFWNADIQDADIVFVYLLPWRMDQLEKKLQTGVKKGTLVVSNSFIFPHWKIVKEDTKNHLYVFTVGE